MQIQFVSKGIDVSSSLRTHVENRLTEITSKYFKRPAEAFATATREGFGFKVEIALHLPSGAFLQASGEGVDAHSAFENAASHLDKRLRRYKGKLKNHHATQKAELPAENSTILVLKSSKPDQSELGPEDIESEDVDPVDPIIIAEQPGQLPTFTVSMAVHELDMVDAPFLMFHNVSSGVLNIVYRRPDGHVGWIDPSRSGKRNSENAFE